MGKLCNNIAIRMKGRLKSLRYPIIISAAPNNQIKVNISIT